MSYHFGFDQPPLATTCGLCQNPFAALIPRDPHNMIRDTDEVELLCHHSFHRACIVVYLCNLRESQSCPLCYQTVRDSANRFMVRIRDSFIVPRNINLNSLVAREQADHLFPHVERSTKFLVLFLVLTDDHEILLAEQMLLGQDPGGRCERVHPDTFAELDGNKQTTALQLAAHNDDVRAANLLLQYGAMKDLLRDDGLSPLDIAKEAGSRKVEAYLRSQGAQYAFYSAIRQRSRDLVG